MSTENLREAVAAPEPSRGSFNLSGKEIRWLVVGAVVFGALFFVPSYASGYVLSLAISIVIFTALATSWMLFSGPTNYISLATAAVCCRPSGRCRLA